jgi:hypothetical protein
VPHVCAAQNNSTALHRQRAHCCFCGIPFLSSSSAAWLTLCPLCPAFLLQGGFAGVYSGSPDWERRGNGGSTDERRSGDRQRSDDRRSDFGGRREFGGGGRGGRGERDGGSRDFGRGGRGERDGGGDRRGSGSWERDGGDRRGSGWDGAGDSAGASGGGGGASPADVAAAAAFQPGQQVCATAVCSLACLLPAAPVGDAT